MKKKLYLLFPLLMLSFITTFSLPLSSSLPGARATIFLDFDGHYVEGTSWHGGASFYCVPSGLKDAQITEIFNRVSEDFRPFDINITTDSTVFLSAPLNQRIRIIITPTSAWYPGVGGVSFTGSFTWGDDTPGFVFPDRLAYSPKIIAECCTHESGHTVGLSHQARYDGSCALLSTYNDGTGTGETGWAPVMGNSYYKNISGWNNGPTPSGCTADQDNLSIITSKNGFSYRLDDHSDDPDKNPTSVTINNSSFLTTGIISTNTDKDAFKFDFIKKGALHLDAKPFSVGPDNEGANLDIKLTLLDSAFKVIRIYDLEEILNIVIDTTLNPGIYYLLVEGTGNANTSNYGSLGSYTISGKYSPVTVTAPRQVLLSLENGEEKHNLSWLIISSEPVAKIVLETSTNSTIFSTLKTFATGTKDYNYEPPLKEEIIFRLKVIFVSGYTDYSNIVILKPVKKLSQLFNVSTIVRSDIKITATENYNYQLMDISGRIIKSGTDGSGVKNINIDNYPNGIYTLQIINNSQRTTKRILKL